MHRLLGSTWNEVNRVNAKYAVWLRSSADRHYSSCRYMLCVEEWPNIGLTVLFVTVITAIIVSVTQPVLTHAVTAVSRTLNIARRALCNAQWNDSCYHNKIVIVVTSNYIQTQYGCWSNLQTWWRYSLLGQHRVLLSIQSLYTCMPHL